MSKERVSARKAFGRVQKEVPTFPSNGSRDKLQKTEC